MQGFVVFAVLLLSQVVFGTYIKTDSYTYGDLEFSKKVTVEFRYSSDLLTYNDAAKECQSLGEGWTLMNQVALPFVVQKMFALVVPADISEVWVDNYDKDATCMIVTRTESYTSKTGQPAEGCAGTLRRAVCSKTTRVAVDPSTLQ
ncbi:uncharacterized protein LOC135502852 [Lineus longissimus]|uniref:uncharacterized protein LOC135502852 n=1 Tax=Lineus longissimus TaxID=88925 RepID=UPI002B4D199A